MWALCWHEWMNSGVLKEGTNTKYYFACTVTQHHTLCGMVDARSMSSAVSWVITSLPTSALNSTSLFPSPLLSCIVLIRLTATGNINYNLHYSESTACIQPWSYFNIHCLCKRGICKYDAIYMKVYHHQIISSNSQSYSFYNFFLFMLIASSRFVLSKFI